MSQIKGALHFTINRLRAGRSGVLVGGGVVKSAALVAAPPSFGGACFAVATVRCLSIFCRVALRYVTR